MTKRDENFEGRIAFNNQRDEGFSQPICDFVILFSSSEQSTAVCVVETIGPSKLLLKHTARHTVPTAE